MIPLIVKQKIQKKIPLAYYKLPTYTKVLGNYSAYGLS